MNLFEPEKSQEYWCNKCSCKWCKPKTKDKCKVKKDCSKCKLGEYMMCSKVRI
jgi:hypothetical protein